MSKFAGVNIREVWDFRLSTAVPHIDTRGGTWVVNICSRNNPDSVDGKAVQAPLESFDTGIASEKGDSYDPAKVAACYDWLLSVRDKYSLDNIEELKPIVAKINAANARQVELAAALTAASAAIGSE